MADLDVTDLFLDPDFAMTVTVQRRLETVGGGGRSALTVTTFDDVVAYVVPVDTRIGGNALERGTDEQHRGAALQIITTFRLRGPSQDGADAYQPDVVIYNGDPYIVDVVNDFSKWGAGFIRAELSSMDSVDAPPT